jgi:hypothetical protein
MGVQVKLRALRNPAENRRKNDLLYKDETFC